MYSIVFDVLEASANCVHGCEVIINVFCLLEIYFL